MGEKGNVVSEAAGGGVIAGAADTASTMAHVAGSTAVQTAAGAAAESGVDRLRRRRSEAPEGSADDAD